MLGTARDAIASARVAFGANRLDEALEHFSTAVVAEPANDYAIAGKAEVLMYMRRSREALALAGECIGLNPQSVDARLVAATAYADLGNLRGCLQALDEASAIDPTDVRPWLEGVRHLLWFRRFREARLVVAQIEEQDASLLDLCFFRCDLAVADGRLEDALRHALKATRDFPDSERAALAAAQCQLRLGNGTAALAWSERALQLSPDWWEAWVAVGKARARLGDLLGATEAYERAFALNPRQPQAYSALIRMYARRLCLRKLWATWCACMRAMQE